MRCELEEISEEEDHQQETLLLARLELDNMNKEKEESS